MRTACEARAQASHARPFSAKRGRWPEGPDGVWKAALDRCRLAAMVVQSDLCRSSGPHPIRRFAPPSPAKLGKEIAPRLCVAVEPADADALSDSEPIIRKSHQMSAPASRTRGVDAAFGLAASAPAAGPLVFAGPDRARAGHAADRRHSLGDQGMARQAGLADIVEHVLRAPADQRVHLHPLALGLEQGQAGARRALQTLCVR